MTWACIVPTNRPDRFATFLDAWTPLFEKHNVFLIPVFDSEDGGLDDPPDFLVCQDNWASIPDFIPRQTDMIRSWGIYRAWVTKATYTLSLDDDVLPEGDLFEAYEKVFDAGAPCSEYFDVGALTSFDGQLRGFPYRDRNRAEVAVQYGGWNGVLDFDAPTQLAGVNAEERFDPVVIPVPRGAAVTGCIMNCAWRTEYAPIMWQLPLLAGRFNRFGDIWSCLFQKRVLDALGKVMVINGKASVRHERASDPLANLEREAPGIPHNEDLWKCLHEDEDFWEATAGMIPEYKCYTGRAYRAFDEVDERYADHFLSARDDWLKLFA